MQPRIFDAFPFFNELDVLEIRLAELAPIVDKFVIVECKETYGGDFKPLYLQSNWSRFAPWHDKIVPVVIDKLEPPQKHRVSEYAPGVSANDVRTQGRQREANAREQILPHLIAAGIQPDDYLSFGDCDEIPSRDAIQRYLGQYWEHIARFKQRTFYYNVNCMIDYGRDICSRARIGRFRDVAGKCDNSLYKFRMYGGKDKPEAIPAIEEGGWHFSYFGGSIEKLNEKVAALAPFLAEYKLFGNAQLAMDIINRKDLHHRATAFSELPETFAPFPSDDPRLPAHFLANPKKFEHFTQAYFASKYRG